MPDIVSRLSDPANEIEEDKFKEIMKYIIGLIDKDKHSESLVRKTKPLHKAYLYIYILIMKPFRKAFPQSLFKMPFHFSDLISR